jgi:hypothetical protein
MICTEQHGRICRNSCPVQTIEESCISIHELVKHRLHLGTFPTILFMNFLPINMRFKGIDKYTKAAERTSGLVLTYMVFETEC